MELSSKNIQLQYQGYLNTPLLWKKQAVCNLKQLELPKYDTTTFKETIPENLLLGKRVERFVHAELQQNKNIKILLENVQIQNQKITIGEIDCIFRQDDIPIHLEIIYKFYLFDPSLGSSETEHWIGPNRNDSLVKKLTKLREKQLPLLYNEHAKPFLEPVHLNADKVLQRVRFKAQLFAPYQTNVNFKLLNSDCLKGFYIRLTEIEQFSACKFHIPIKVDWLLEVRTDVDWMSYDQFQKKITVIINEKRAPLCWIKFPNGMLQKFFVVWWGANNDAMK